jgi:three-Cys-motif partner protein
MAQHKFGGGWTNVKLEHVRKYLRAYTTIMNSFHFRFAYIDAFAGTGYRTLKESENAAELMLPKMFEEEVQEFFDGSARVALEITPQFSKYIFIEKDETRFGELQQLKEEFPDLQADIKLVRNEANSYVQELCSYDWLRSGHRAVLFLDPYGMAVKWKTIEAIANTQAIDLWLLFPLGIAVNRLLRNDGQIDLAVQNTLNEFFGAEDWFDEFYREDESPSLFENLPGQQKVADFDSIETYFIRRLESVFTEVAKNPLRLYNSRNNPLYLLCFAAGNSKGASTAVKIAQDILKA